jgi:hypothetical protein
MDETGESGKQQPSTDIKGVAGVFAITFAYVPGMLEKQLIQHFQYLLFAFPAHLIEPATRPYRQSTTAY